MTSSSGTYLETLPKDIIGYLRGFTGPDQLYQIRYQYKGKRDNNSTYYYCMYATTKKVRDNIDKLISSNEFNWNNIFVRILNVYPFDVPRFDLESWDDPLETIVINEKLHYITPVKTNQFKYIFSSVADFEKTLLNYNTKNRRCPTPGCPNECPKELDICWLCQSKKCDTSKRKISRPEKPGQIKRGIRFN